MAKIFVHIANDNHLDDIVVTSVEMDFKPTKGEMFFNHKITTKLSDIANDNKNKFPYWQYKDYTYPNGEIDFEDAIYVKEIYHIYDDITQKMYCHIELSKF